MNDPASENSERTSNPLWWLVELFWRSSEFHYSSTDATIKSPNGVTLLEMKWQRASPQLTMQVDLWRTVRFIVGEVIKSTPKSRHRKPPLNAEFLFYLFVTPQNCDALVGDLEERYKLIRKKFGRRRADFWFWTQTVISLGPIVWAWAKKVSLKPALAIAGWAVAKGFVGHDSWLAALVEMWRRVRS